MGKHLFYYAQHSQYVEPTDKPAVSYCEQENEVHYAAVGSVTLITFTVSGTSYQAEEGMTWGDWVDSSYNTGGFVLNTGHENTIATDNTFGWLVNDSNGLNVYATTTIVAGYQYRIGATDEVG